jgi:hypothetical protein
MIAQALLTLKNLTQLNLNLEATRVNNMGAASIANALYSLKNLTELTLNLSENKLSSEN